MQAQGFAKGVALNVETLIEAYRTMYLSRRMDDKEVNLKRQNRVYFQISSAGHEAITTAAGMLLRPGTDWLYCHYRDRALCLQLGMTPYEQFLGSVAAKEDPNSGARQMPSHWGLRRLNMVSKSSNIGTHFLHAVGSAEAGMRTSLIPELADRADGFSDDELVYVSCGDGSTSEGEFWESLNTACNLRLPVLYLVEDNGYAISTPVEVQTAGGSISRLVSGFPELYVQECDGTDFLESYDVMESAVAWCRERRAPALVHAHVTRPYSHSLSDDETLYRPAEEREVEARRDPIHRMESFLLREGLATEADLARIREAVDREVDEAADRAMAMGQPTPAETKRYIYSPDVDPTSAAFDTEAGAELAGNEGTMVDLINRCLHEEMRRDPRIVVLGQDVADASRSQYLGRVKGKGGVFKVTANLQREFGDARVFNTPLAEANIIGRSLGMAVRGLKPVAEIQFFDYIWPAYQQLHNEVPLVRWRSNNAWKCPMVVRTTIGGYLRGGAIYHSQSAVSLFTQIPGWRVVMPSNALDAAGLLRTALRCDDPVVFLEHKHLYRQTYNKSRFPGLDFMIPFGKAKVVREGSDVTIVTFGALVQKALLAAKQAEDEGCSVEVIDLRSLVPYDWEAISRSVKKTSRVIIAHEDMQSFGFGAEIASRIAKELFEFLDAPVNRVAADDTFVPYAPEVEEAVLPQVEDLAAAIRETARY
ncbi:MAG: dehydrogenase E1 component subunit alpha/beta [Blastocatellia bacterium]|nr:dehydrogenase E1 component subunit alpha/beta [Blastocatellia bacterium]